MGMKVVRSRDAVTASLKVDSDLSTLPNRDFNGLIGKLLRKLSTVIADEDLEFDGITGPDYSKGEVSLTARLFVP